MPTSTGCLTLFLRFSEESAEIELKHIVTAFTKGEELPALPATLGTTRFCTLKPGE
jgi:hypothetical protein